jgi:hypothetical protein
MSTASRIKAIDQRVLPSALWIFAVLNYLYCDVVSFHRVVCNTNRVM